MTKNIHYNCISNIPSTNFCIRNSRCPTTGTRTIGVTPEVPILNETTTNNTILNSTNNTQGNS
jgi:hypothetical protein